MAEPDVYVPVLPFHVPPVWVMLPLLLGLTEMVRVYPLLVVNVVVAALLSQVPLTAFTWKVYEVPAVRPVRLTEFEVVVVHVLPPLMLYL